MKIRKLAFPILSLILSFSAMSVRADNLDNDFKSLGGNSKLIKRAKELSPKGRYQIVQNRLVDRNFRLELGANYGLVAGGDSYVSTQNVGFNVDFHISPRWSLGARYYQSQNELTSQGKSVLRQAEEARRQDPAAGQIFDVDYPKSTLIGVVNFYPIYGKLNFFDLSVAQFDVYVLGGAGQVQLESGTTSTYTAGGGVGIWWNKFLSSRVEARYQRYHDQVYTGPRDIDLTAISFSMGFIL